MKILKAFTAKFGDRYKSDVPATIRSDKLNLRIIKKWYSSLPPVQREAAKNNMLVSLQTGELVV